MLQQETVTALCSPRIHHSQGCSYVRYCPRSVFWHPHPWFLSLLSHFFPTLISWTNFKSIFHIDSSFKNISWFFVLISHDCVAPHLYSSQIYPPNWTLAVSHTPNPKKRLSGCQSSSSLLPSWILVEFQVKARGQASIIT